MQEELILKPKTEYHIDNLDLDYTKLSASEEFGEKLESFNERYETELVATKGARWQPGTYDKIKNYVPTVMYPHWKTRRGANSISKLLQRNRWNYSNFKTDLQGLDDMLYNYRRDGMELYKDSDIDESKDMLKEIIESLSMPTKDIVFDISPVPYFGKQLRYREYNNTLYTDCRLFPIIEPNMEIIGSANHEIYSGLDNYKSHKEYMIDKETHPGKWYVNMLVSLKDVTVSVTNSELSHTYSELPYGDIIVGFTVDLMTLCTNYRRIKDKKSLIKTGFIGYASTVFPHYEALSHPFVYRKYENRTSLSWFTAYGNGNTCFGDLAKDIYQSLCIGNLKMLKTYLKIWSSSFTVGSTSPLNSLQTTHFGLPKEWNELTRSMIATDKNVCQKQIDLGIDKQEFKDKFCSNCALTNNCSIYTRLSFIDMNWKDNPPASWIEMYPKMVDYFDGEIDKKVMYELFNDLYFYLIMSKEPNWLKVLKVFGMTNNMQYFDDDWVDFLVEWKSTPMTNIKEMFNRCEYAWTLRNISTDNPDMFHQLVEKIKGMPFKEAIKVFTTSDMEDNHYSWLFATVQISSKNDYYTYTKHINQRKEGLRYAS